MAEMTDLEKETAKKILDRFGEKDVIDFADENQMTRNEAILVARAIYDIEEVQAQFTVAMARGEIKGDVAPDEEFDEDEDRRLYGAA